MSKPASALNQPKVAAHRTTWKIAGAIAALTFLAYLPALGADFITWDDDRNFLDNPHFRGLGLSQLKWMWTTFLMGHYIPLSWMTLGFDYVVWGMNPTGYHLSNIVLHCANAILVFVVARKLFELAQAPDSPANPRYYELPSALAALLFAIHPLRVESVAWITERRDMLSMLFYLTCILLYLRSATHPNHKARSYWTALGVFGLALLSKGTTVTLPAVLALLNVYPLRRIGGQAGWWNKSARAVYAGLVPFALLSAAISALAVVALRPPDQLDIGGKIAVSAYSLGFYLWKTLAPLNLAPLYEMPKLVDPLSMMFMPGYAVAVAYGAVAWGARRRWPAVTAILVLYFVAMLPLLGIVQNGPQIVADRYTYHTAPILAVLVAAGFMVFSRRHAGPAKGLAAACVLTFGILTWKQNTHWIDSERLWSQVLRVDPESSIAHVALGNVLIKQNRLQDGVDHYSRGIAIDTGYAEGHNNLGVVLARLGRFDEAIARYHRALALKPRYDEAEANLGAALAALGQHEEANRRYKRALDINPDNADARTNWGNALIRLGQRGAAIEQYKETVRRRPDHAAAHFNWGVALAQQGSFAEAIEHFQKTLSSEPTHADARQYLETATRLLERTPPLP